MKIWLTSFVLLFALAQLFQWIKHWSPPLPIFILAGLCLAIASNYDKRSGWPFRNNLSGVKENYNQTPTIVDSIDASKSRHV